MASKQKTAPTAAVQKTTLAIDGMHCASCAVLLERRLRKVAGVTKVHVSVAQGKATLEHETALNTSTLRAAINQDGYTLVTKNKPVQRPPPTRTEYVQTAVVAIVLVLAYFIGKRFDLFPSVGVSDTMSLGFVVVIGLIAGTSSCLAVTGGLLLAITANHSERYPNLSGIQKFKPTLYFNIGRVIGYTVFGALLGALGGLLTLSPFVSGLLTVIAALIMIVLGFQMLRLFPFFNKLAVPVPKWIAHRIHDKANGSYKPWAPFVLGAGTFFVPCGFTQALQFYVLAKGSVLVGATTMAAFSLGTLPMLLVVGAASSFTKGSLHQWFIRVAGVLVVLLGLLSLPAGIALIRMG